ncbi:hypothetical protein [Novosphingobium album (ex Hu et al. 2023)]|uniref:Uncharacterized protein n=1 Tax=Novosphingobium album (ex Hu et al. 2023) TaxID=2930093 RepID=A0ABT0AWL3_9SPHN|nr:hypothetical protein [Novosphingobium album (ex Hu et al. 2023)]MCJ2177199.1 hypothetical protein [Novosphingobium album (ex Hu et al. 2023)]
MSFIDFSDAAHMALPVPHADLPVDIRTIGFAEALTVQEHRIVELARHDGLETLRTPRKRGWLARLILGPQPASAMLANERLEALRRLAVQAWHKGYRLPVSALKEAHTAGFSEDQIGAVIDTIGRARPPFRKAAA